MQPIRVKYDDLDLSYDDLVYLYKDKRFTGIAYDELGDGTVEEQTYRDGLMNGPSRTYYPDGQLKEQSQVHLGVLHGDALSWHENGQLASKGVYEHGIRVSETTWDENGMVTGESQIKQGDPLYDILESRRLTYDC